MTTPQSDKPKPGGTTERKLNQDPTQSSEVPLGSGSRPEPAGKGGFGSHSDEPGAGASTDSTLPPTSHIDDKLE
jgi:hypothetical protein